jgi:hypothetical protein
MRSNLSPVAGKMLQNLTIRADAISKPKRQQSIFPRVNLQTVAKITRKNPAYDLFEPQIEPLQIHPRPATKYRRNHTGSASFVGGV